ncbi:ADP-ribosylation factor-binding protein GGA1 isoform X2 [Agrilus planipennis]|uniref:ADP-ribosylation factor-binding protein GGA1 isoform X2 n=1 Tax=Agrilus planipennis TaxID=224129 RepID=A0A1W4X202_AGRPL|nr:ADP-ribosylation factor-binding protein GGA1 isoform X2 [Agrilus planipennis]
MDILTTSLTALLHAATNPNHPNLDRPSVEAFCAIINREKIGPPIALKLIANRLHTKNEKQTLLTLDMLDVCMKRCNSLFVSEVAKFRFLNEMIKLVSPKYLGSQTTFNVKQKVIHSLENWSKDYPKESKIREALEMLRKQGVVPVDPLINNTEKKSHSVFYDEEKTKLLNKLLQSKNPEDLQAANRLIKNMVKEDERASEFKARKITELESVYNNVKLLTEMLDSYRPGISSSDDLELIKELYQSCQRLRSNIFKLASESQNNEEILSKVLQANDELGNVFDKYTEVIIKGNIQDSCKTLNSDRVSLLDLDFKTDNTLKESPEKVDKEKASLDLLGDIFTPDESANHLLKEDILKPSSVSKVNNTEGGDKSKEVSRLTNKSSALDDLGELGQYLIKEQLNSQVITTFKKFPDKVPINTLIKNASKDETKDVISEALNLDLNYLISKENKDSKRDELHYCLPEDKDDEILVDIGKDLAYDSLSECSDSSFRGQECSGLKSIKEEENKRNLNIDDIFIRLADIEPSGIPPLTILKEVQDVTVTLQFGKNKPKEFVQVVVVTTINKNKQSLNNYLFQVVVPKSCRVKLLSPSSTELPAYNAFIPPMAITQIMLIANPNHLQLKLKYVISFAVGDETVMETGEAVILPVINSYN